MKWLQELDGRWRHCEMVSIRRNDFEQIEVWVGGEKIGTYSDWAAAEQVADDIMRKRWGEPKTIVLDDPWRDWLPHY